MKTITIGNAGGFWGDDIGAAATLLQHDPLLDYLTLDYLAELSMAILADQRAKDPKLGYAGDFVEVVKTLIPYWQQGGKAKVITNAGGLNPQGCAVVVWQLIQEAGLKGFKIGVVSGDDVLPQLLEHPTDNLETGAPFEKVAKNIVTANVYLGADPIRAALQQGAHVVLTGRVADPSLTVAPCLATWGWTDPDRIAAATIAGHLIECGRQVTGGISTDWLACPEGAPFPVVEMGEDGTFVVTKPERTGGCVTVETVKEQLLYEMGDPECYLSPDGVASIREVDVLEVGKDRIQVSGVKGKAPTATYKVSACYKAGYRAEGMLVVVGPEAALKAERCGEMIKAACPGVKEMVVECLGRGDVVPGVLPTIDPPECVLRIAAFSPQKEPLQQFVRAFAPLVTAGPQGVTGYATGRPKIRPAYGFWPCLIERDRVKPQVTILEVT